MVRRDVRPLQTQSCQLQLQRLGSLQQNCAFQINGCSGLQYYLEEMQLVLPREKTSMRRCLSALGLTFAIGIAGFLGAAPQSARADVVARINLSTQQMVVYVDGRARYGWDVSTARRGYVTPVGSYRPTRMHRMWYSRKYDMAPMPNSVFFRGGYAIHGTPHVRSLGRPASHGCVRLAPENARTLYQLIAARGMNNTRVVITR
ncbi:MULTISPECIES: L,D-transpeptidase [Kaistia]